MTTGELIRARHKGSQGLGPAHTYQADEALAAALPRLALPCMGEAARAALRVVIPLEVPYTNEDLEDCLALAEARGFCTDPRDWVPDFTCPRRHPASESQPCRISRSFETSSSRERTVKPNRSSIATRPT